MQAGKLDQRITLQTKSVVKDAIGGETATWSTLATVWASYRPLRVSERIQGAQLAAEFDAIFRIRPISGIDAETRIVWRDENYELTGQPMIIDPRTGDLELYATKGLRAGR